MIGLFRLPCVLLACVVSACSGGRSSADGDRHYAGLSCAPFARELTGIQLHGAAAGWWDAAAGRYDRVSAPEIGSVLVFRSAARLPLGHVSVVSRVRGPRRIDVIGANWVPGELERDQPVVDVSAANDWSLVRVWYAPLGQLGSHSYQAYGFILPHAPLGHDALASAAGPAATRTVAGRY